ncbi:MAG: hypothetical protein PHC64_04330 [Candidatus Gastranaerophilales bacterium]|nr:hypothetical protein [Candidatus Gastranaerophilales bacterium]
MVTSVNNVTPAANSVRALDKVSSEQLQARGKYSIDDYAQLPPPPPVEQESQGGGFFGFIGKILLVAIGIGLLAVGARRYIPRVYGMNTKVSLPSNAKFLDRVSYDVARAADWLKAHTIDLVRQIKKSTTSEVTPTGDHSIDG